MQIPGLYHFFRRQVQNGLGRINLDERPAVDYLSDLLTRFSRTSALYPYRDNDGRALEHIIDFLALQQPASALCGRAGKSRNISISRYIGEYTLFMSGLFRDRLKARCELDYYEAHGCSAFGLCADYAIQPERQRLFSCLSHNFHSIGTALAQIRQRPGSLENHLGSPLAALWLR